MKRLRDWSYLIIGLSAILIIGSWVWKTNAVRSWTCPNKQCFFIGMDRSQSGVSFAGLNSENHWIIRLHISENGEHYDVDGFNFRIAGGATQDALIGDLWKRPNSSDLNPFNYCLRKGVTLNAELSMELIGTYNIDDGEEGYELGTRYDNSWLIFGEDDFGEFLRFPEIDVQFRDMRYWLDNNPDPRLNLYIASWCSNSARSIENIRELSAGRDFEPFTTGLISEVNWKGIAPFN